MFKYLYLAQEPILKAPQGLGSQKDIGGIFLTVTNVLLFVAGAIAVIFILVGAIKYATSGGNDQQVKSAKDTIVNAIVGLIIAILAILIVNFVITIF